MLSKTVESLLSVEFIYCACGCGKTKPRYDKFGVERLFIQGHHTKLNPKRGTENSMYNNGRHVSKKYIYRNKPDHHFAHKNGMVYEHRLVYEEYYKCCLLPWGDIHHLNENKHDNRIENLQLLSKIDHNKLSQKNYFEKRRKEILKRICCICNNKTLFCKIKQSYLWFRNPKNTNEWLCNACYKRYRRGRIVI